MIDYIQKGGLLMWPILVCSIIAIAVFAERLFYFHRATIHVGEFLQGLSNLLQRRNFAEALHECAGTPGPVARLVKTAILNRDILSGHDLAAQVAAHRASGAEVTLHLCEVEDPRWTRDGKRRAPSFKGLRDDNAIEDTVREEPPAE